MARYRKTRFYKRKSGRWSSNIRSLVEKTIDAPFNSSFYGTVDLCQNPVQDSSTVSQQYTAKNVELNAEIEYTSGGSGATPFTIESLTAYVMYVPQGMIVTETYPGFHPEYIMAMRFIGSPTSDTSNPTRQPFKIKTRLARRLQTGDKIVLLITGTNDGATSTQNVVLKFNGLIRWWTKAN